MLTVFVVNIACWCPLYVQWISLEHFPCFKSGFRFVVVITTLPIAVTRSDVAQLVKKMS